MKIELSPEERDLLLHLVEREISELGPEVRHTDDSRFRDGLRANRRLLQHVEQALQSAPATA
jgi:hypothetical protein